jgi:hypothetical protein
MVESASSTFLETYWRDLSGRSSALRRAVRVAAFDERLRGFLKGLEGPEEFIDGPRQVGGFLQLPFFEEMLDPLLQCSAPEEGGRNLPGEAEGVGEPVLHQVPGCQLQGAVEPFGGLCHGGDQLAGVLGSPHGLVDLAAVRQADGDLSQGIGPLHRVTD